MAPPAIRRPRDVDIGSTDLSHHLEAFWLAVDFALFRPELND
jgi:hypothetical protein